MTIIQTDVTTPRALMEAFSARLNAADLPGLIALYEPTACFEPEPGVVVRGRPAIEQALGELLRSRPTITATVEQVLEGGDIALVVNAWAMTATAPDGSVLRRDGRSTDVVRRQPDGTWLVAIDKP